MRFPLTMVLLKKVDNTPFVISFAILYTLNLMNLKQRKLMIFIFLLEVIGSIFSFICFIALTFRIIRLKVTWIYGYFIVLTWKDVARCLQDLFLVFLNSINPSDTQPISLIYQLYLDFGY